MKLYRTFTCAVVCFVIVNCTFGAVTINLIFNAGSGYFVKPDGTSNLDETGLLQYGVLDVSAFNSLTPEQQGQMSSVSSVFSPYGSFSFDTSGYITGLPAINIPLSGGTAGDQLSVFVFQGNDFGVFSSTNALWDYPGDPGSATLSGADVGVSYVGSIIEGTPDTFQLVTSVPEPAHFGLILGIIGLVLVRRRKRLGSIN